MIGDRPRGAGGGGLVISDRKLVIEPWRGFFFERIKANYFGEGHWRSTRGIFSKCRGMDNNVLLRKPGDPKLVIGGGQERTD